MSLFDCWTVWVLLTQRPAYFGVSDLVQAGALSIFTICNLIRAGYAWVFEPLMTDFMHASTFHGAMILLNILVIILITLSEIIMNAQRLEYDYRLIRERLELAADSGNIGLYAADLHTGEAFLDPRFERILGYKPGELNFEVQDWLASIHPDDQPMLLQSYEAVLNGQRMAYESEYRARHRSGDWIWILDRGQGLDPDASGRPRRVSGAMMDLTARKQMETALRESEEALRVSLAEIQHHADQMTTLNRMNDLLLSCANPEEAYAVIAHSAKQLFAPYNGGLAVCQDNAPELQVVVSWGAAPSLCASFSRDDCWALRRGELHVVADPAHDLACRHFQGTPGSAYLCVPLIAQGQTLGLLQLSAPGDLPAPVFQDLRILATTVSESIKLALSNLYLREALREQAVRDPLTGLFNRRYLDETLSRELRRCQRNGELLAVAMLDLDHFKQFNDVYGHEAGDVVLRAIGELLKSSLRGGDIACRYGGEELTVILPGAALEQARLRLDHLRRAVMDLHLPYRGDVLPAITISIGLAEAQPDETDAAALLARADAALYQAKEQGRNRVVVA
jgi:diguanylate cyclase (GGDEF)-like protein/PAS domain S-box-containing protein